MNLQQKVLDVVKNSTGIEKNAIGSIYQYGSRVYGCYGETSDWDFMVVHSYPGVEEFISEGDINIHLLNEGVYHKNLMKHEPIFMLTMWTPNIKTIENVTSWGFPRQKVLTINYELIYKKFNEEKDICINKSKRFFTKDKRISLKNIIHSIRYLMFAIQIFSKGMIEDYTVANIFYSKMFKLNFETWEEYFDEFKPVLENFKKELDDLFDDFKNIQLKYKTKKEGIPLMTMEFLKDHGVMDLKKYFFIDVQKIDNYYILKSKFLDDSIISKECNPLVLNLSCDRVMGTGLLNYDCIYEVNLKEWMHKELRIEKFSETFSFFFDEKYNDWKNSSPNQISWDYSAGKIIEKLFEISDQSKCFIFSKEINEFNLVSVIDMETLQNVNISKYVKYFSKEKSFVSINSGGFSYIDFNYNNYIIDKNENQLNVPDPSDYFSSKIKNGEMDQEDAFLNIIRLIFQFNFYTNMENKFSIKDMRIFEKLKQKFENLMYTIISSKDDPYFVDVHKYMDAGGTVGGYFLENDLKTLKHFMSYKKESEPILKIWNEIQMIETLPKEIIQMILTFVDPLSLRYISSDIISKQFKWIQSDDSMIKEALKTLDFGMVDAYSFSRLIPHFDSNIFHTYSRIMPYSPNYQNELNLYDNIYLFKERKLNSLELSLFDCADSKPKKITSYDNFIKKMNSKFYFDSWKDYINWNYFHIAGGSILNCILEESFDSTDQDVDIFFHSSTGSFDNQFQLFLDAIQNFKPNVKYSNFYVENVRTVSMEIDSKPLKIQFISLGLENFSGFLSTFDVDCCQIGFNSQEIVTTFSFIQSINTGAMMNYKLNEKDIYDTTQDRIIKYKSRGFQLMTPKGWKIEDCETIRGGSFDPNFDSFGIVDKFKKEVLQ
jgi:hypothetical protein